MYVHAYRCMWVYGTVSRRMQMNASIYSCGCIYTYVVINDVGERIQQILYMHVRI